MSAPALLEDAFNCPHCGAYAQQRWLLACGSIVAVNSLAALKSSSLGQPNPSAVPRLGSLGQRNALDVQHVKFSECIRCQKVAIWIADRLTSPTVNLAPRANLDMPKNVREDYYEAALILDASPRGAAALLRLGLQKLCVHLGEPGKHIDTDIASLVSKGLDVRVQQALDAVRVIGNEAVHPGSIDLRANRETAEMLFQLMNLIVEKMISEPKHVQSVYDKLPQTKREAIERRDQK
ncbi:DUF4145 domain-containing protein [Ruegeria atlantica]|nr:DUF4145 domain-containing protein [Ruegeria atlantica]